VERSELRSARGAVAAVFFVNGAAMASWFVRIPAVRDGLGLSAGRLGLVLLCVAGRARKMPLAAAIAAVASCGYAGFLVGPPVIGFTAEVTNLWLALASVLVLSTVVAVLGGTVGQKSARAVEGEEGR
jgi:cyanate permease